MFDIKDDAKSSYRRVEVLTGPGRRRHWSAQEKAQIVGETLTPGMSVSEVARRWQICPQQIYTWRRTMRRDPCDSTAPAFVPIVTEAMPSAPAAGPRSVAPMIEVQLAGAVVRVAPGTDNALLTTVLRAVRTSALSA
jgi:transposase